MSRTDLYVLHCSIRHRHLVTKTSSNRYHKNLLLHRERKSVSRGTSLEMCQTICGIALEECFDRENSEVSLLFKPPWAMDVDAMDPFDVQGRKLNAKGIYTEGTPTMTGIMPKMFSLGVIVEHIRGHQHGTLVFRNVISAVFDIVMAVYNDRENRLTIPFDQKEELIKTAIFILEKSETILDTCTVPIDDHYNQHVSTDAQTKSEAHIDRLTRYVKDCINKLLVLRKKRIRDNNRTYVESDCEIEDKLDDGSFNETKARMIPGYVDSYYRKKKRRINKTKNIDVSVDKDNRVVIGGANKKTAVTVRNKAYRDCINATLRIMEKSDPCLNILGIDARRDLLQSRFRPVHTIRTLSRDRVDDPAARKFLSESRDRTALWCVELLEEAFLIRIMAAFPSMCSHIWKLDKEQLDPNEILHCLIADDDSQNSGTRRKKVLPKKSGIDIDDSEAIKEKRMNDSGESAVCCSISPKLFGRQSLSVLIYSLTFFSSSAFLLIDLDYIVNYLICCNEENDTARQPKENDPTMGKFVLNGKLRNQIDELRLSVITVLYYCTHSNQLPRHTSVH